MVWQSLRAFAWGLITSPFKIYKLFGFIVKATLYFFVFSLISCLFIFAFAADDYVPASPSSERQVYVMKFTGQSFVSTSSDPQTICGQLPSYGAAAAWTDYTVIGQGWVCLLSGRYVHQSVTGTRCSDPTIVNLKGYSAACSEAYFCPPKSSPDYTVGPVDLNGQKVCYKRSCLSNNNWFDSSMELGTGTACATGCKYTVTSSFLSSTGNNTFIAKYTGDTCSCPGGALHCWQDRTPNTEGDNDDTGTCYAWDSGEVKGVDCGKNGEMTVDLQPINDSLVAQSKSITDLQTNDKLQNEYLVKNTNDIAGLRVDVDALKAQGCSVSQSANGVTITCNGQSATALNGKDGKDGKDGVDGANGAKGLDGAPGEKGEKGDTGATGATGATGEKGDKGDKGDNGQDGVDGQNGEKGDKGETGAQGIAGVAGAAGRDGVDGQNGEDGEDGEGVTAVQDGIDVNLVSAKTGARLATLKGIDRDGIVTELEKSNSTLSEINEKLDDISKPEAPTEVSADYSDKFKVADPATRNFSTVLQHHVEQMKNTEMFQALSGFFSVSFNGDCSPITFDFTVYSQSFNISIDPFCNLTIWPYVRAVVMCVFGFFAFRVGFDN